MLTLATIQPFYIIVAIVIVCCVFDIVYKIIIKPTVNKNKVHKELLETSKKLNIPVEIEKNTTDGADYLIKVNNNSFFAKVLITPKNCDLQINNIDTFVVYQKASGGNMKTSMLNNLTTFMNSKEDNRIVLLSNKAKTIKKVINECEMIMVDSTTNVYNVRILNYKDFESLFK